MSTWQKTIDRLDAYERLIRLDKPIGWLLLLWPTLTALWFAAYGQPSLKLVWIFVLGTILMRSAGCAVNDYADREFDRAVERTKNRPLAKNEIAPWEALVVGAALALCAFLFIVPLNSLVFWLSVVAVVIAATYPFTKRFFVMPQAYLGIAFSFGIPIAFAAVMHEVPPLAWALMLANAFWVIAYDTEYAMVDRDDDRRLRINTSAILFGRSDVLIIMFCYLAYLGLMLAVGIGQRMGWLYYAGLATAAAIAVYHYLLIRGRSREGCFKAFRHNNWLGLAVFAGTAFDFIVHRHVWPMW